jgi:hypothetical protein
MKKLSNYLNPLQRSVNTSFNASQPHQMRDESSRFLNYLDSMDRQSKDQTPKISRQVSPRADHQAEFVIDDADRANRLRRSLSKAQS